MKVLIAPDSFKDSLSAEQVILSISMGINKVDASVTVEGLPLADGGEGTMEALTKATGGEFHSVQVHDALMRPVSARIGLLDGRHTAIIEMAEASGLEQLAVCERNPLLTSTYGTGELIEAALDLGCRKLIIAIGGSATNDGGAGMAQALGIGFLDAESHEVIPCGGNLLNIAHIRMEGKDHRLKECETYVACDVTNPLLGKNGAAHVFANQKGADSQMIEQLELGMSHYAGIVQGEMNTNFSTLPGAGAAGGLGFGLMAFLDGKLQPGFKLVAEITDLESKIRTSDLVITGEGKIDSQTQYGKTVFGVAQLAKKFNKPVLCMAGSLDKGSEVLYSHGVTAMFSLINKPMGIEEAKQNATELLTFLSENAFRLYLERLNKNSHG